MLLELGGKMSLRVRVKAEGRISLMPLPQRFK